MQSLFNRSVKTPLGQGVVQSPFMVIDETAKYLIRLPVNDQTALHLKDSNCMTPRAVKSGLWVFTKQELSGEGSNAHWVGGGE